ncbi:hypothetical protein PSCLAVI8L_20037 [Pseudoclavibacter sp. 8L]|nr:hypothetical protein PSCLAVI8L_20037 [Pseudoclavibacter sp. 8L]
MVAFGTRQSARQEQEPHLIAEVAPCIIGSNRIRPHRITCAAKSGNPKRLPTPRRVLALLSACEVELVWGWRGE